MLRVTILLLVALSIPRPGDGAQVTVAFEGVLARVEDDYDLFAGAAEGTPFSGTYFYDDATAGDACEPFLPTDRCAVYDFGAQPTAGIYLDIGGATFSLSNADDGLHVPLRILIQDQPTDVYLVEWVRRLDGGTADDFFRLRLSDPHQVEEDFLGTTDLIVPTIGAASVPPGNFFGFVARSTPDRNELRIVDGRPIIVLIPGQRSEATGAISSLRVVPEPTALALLGIATAALLVARRRH